MMTSFNLAELKRQKQELQAQKVRAREAAARMQLTEAQYVALGEADQPVHVLNQDLKTLLKQLVDAGELMALTRNDAVVIEHHGAYVALDTSESSLEVFQDQWTLLLKLDRWRYGFLVNEAGRISLQFYDAFGEAVHKVYVTEHTDKAAFFRIVEPFSREAQAEDWPSVQAQDHRAKRGAKLLDVEALRNDWRMLAHRDNAERVFELYKVTPPQAYVHFVEDARRLQPSALKALLEGIAELALVCKMTLSNRGAVQNHIGNIHRLLETGPWFNVLDPKFNLHARINAFSEVWAISKPFGDGLEASVECFDTSGRRVLSIMPHPQTAYSRTQTNGWYNLLEGLACYQGEEHEVV